MKLRTQQLLRSWKDQPTEFDKKLELFAKGMIEQIDALANIASEFSSFAKMPKPTLLPVNLIELIESVTSLYLQESKTEINLRKYNIQNETFLLDKDQIIRVLNNIITNAIQAIPNDRKGIIDIAVRGSKRGLIIRIQDNGTGISSEVKAKLFVPNFTTKSTGSGLGLTMVKNIMLQNNGTVRCFSNEQQGTSFFLFFDA